MKEYFKAIALVLIISLLNGCRLQSSEDYSSLKNILILKNKEYEVYKQGSHDLIQSFQEASEAIQFAVNRIDSTGGVIELLSGKYIVRNQINLKSKLTLKGSGESTELYFGQNHNTGTAIFGENLDNVTIADLSIKSSKDNDNARTGIHLASCGDCTVENIYGVGMKDYGIRLSKNSFLSEIKGCKLAGIGKSGILIDSLRKGRGGDFLPNLVSNCMTYGCGTGIECNRAIVVNIEGCLAHQNKDYGYLIHNTSNSILLTGSRTFQIEGDAVAVRNSHEINITGNIFCWQEGHGIVLDDVTWGTVTGNNVIDNGSFNAYDFSQPVIVSGKRELFHKLIEDNEVVFKNGIYLLNNTRGLTINANAIFNWGVVPPMANGILEDNSCSYNIITNNNINFVDHQLVNSMGKQTVVENNTGNEKKSFMLDGYYQKGEVQSFDPRILEEFIENQR